MLTTALALTLSIDWMRKSGWRQGAVNLTDYLVTGGVILIARCLR